MMISEYTHGALFSGSGGFELAAANFGIKTLWASEIEPFPIRVTKKNFPEMEHLGDISRLSGSKLPAVDIVSGGSPCQDMSIAGSREGLDGNRSALFKEYIRVTKEMRKKYGDKPRYFIWENVPGAFSSNGSEDFRCVLEKICRIAHEGCNVPRPPKGKWGGNGAIVGDGFSIAWRLLDAQYWGVPQRRSRIYLVADFGGDTAPKILFERESVSWNPPQSSGTRERAAAGIEAGSYAAGGVAIALDYHPQDSRIRYSSDGNIQTLTGNMGTGGNNVPLVMETGGHITGYAMQSFAGQYKESDKASTIKKRDYKDAADLIVEAETKVRKLTPLECCRLQGFPDGWADDTQIKDPAPSEIKFWIRAWAEHWALIDRKRGVNAPKDEKAVRRWLEKEPTDAELYRMWGNGIALPCACFIMDGIAQELKEGGDLNDSRKTAR